MGRRAQAWFREFDGYWYGVVVKGTPPRKLLKASNTKANQRKAEDIFTRLRKTTNPDASLDDAPSAVLVEAFLLHAEQACKPTTFRTYLDNLNCFTGHCGRVLCRELSFQHADGFIKKQAAKKKRKIKRTISVNGQERTHIVTVGPWGPNMQAGFIKCLKACFNWGVKTGKLSRHPFGQLRATFRRSKRSVVPEATVRKLFEKADPPLKDLLTALRETGCRPSEIARVTAADVHGPTWVLDVHKTEETGQPRVVWLNQAMQGLTKRLIEENPTGPLFRNSRGKPWTKNAIVIRFRKLREELGLPASVIAYATGRHSYITTALTNGVPTEVVAHLTGTSERVIKRHYAHLDSEADFMLNSAEQATRRSS
jgi:site-specific recombinase XerD